MVITDLDRSDLECVVGLEMNLVFRDPKHGYYTGIAVGHPPTPTEKIVHWEQSGAAERFQNALKQQPFVWPPE